MSIEDGSSMVANSVKDAASKYRKDLQDLLANAMSEYDLLDTVIEYAKLRGWLVYHARPARTLKGWRTAVQGHVGFPDLVLAHPSGSSPRVVFVELKSTRGRIDAAQRGWLDTLRMAVLPPTHTLVDVWRPSDWLDGSIRRVLDGAT